MKYMANQKELNSYLFWQIKAALATYDPEDGEKEISYAEAEEALQRTISRLRELPIKF